MGDWRRTVPDVVEIEVGCLDEIDDPGCREFVIGDGDWPVHGFIVRQGSEVFAYQNICAHVGHPLNWSPDSFLTKDKSAIICSAHGAMFDIRTGHCFAGPGSGGALKKLDIRIHDTTVYVSGPDSLRS